MGSKHMFRDRAFAKGGDTGRITPGGMMGFINHLMILFEYVAFVSFCICADLCMSYDRCLDCVVRRI